MLWRDCFRPGLSQVAQQATQCQRCEAKRKPVHGNLSLFTDITFDNTLRAGFGFVN